MTSSSDLSDFADSTICVRHKPINQSRLADTGMAQQDGDFGDQQRRDGVERVVASSCDDVEVEVGELLCERGDRREIGFGQAQNRYESAGISRDQSPVDE